MVVFFELAFFVVALAMIVVAETFGPRTSLVVTLALLAISFLTRAAYAARPIQEPSVEADLPHPATIPGTQAALQEREELELMAFQVEAARSWRHFNLLLLPLGAVFLIWMLITP